MMTEMLSSLPFDKSSIVNVLCAYSISQRSAVTFLTQPIEDDVFFQTDKMKFKFLAKIKNVSTKQDFVFTESCRTHAIQM